MEYEKGTKLKRSHLIFFFRSQDRFSSLEEEEWQLINQTTDYCSNSKDTTRI